MSSPTKVYLGAYARDGIGGYSYLWQSHSAKTRYNCVRDRAELGGRFIETIHLEAIIAVLKAFPADQELVICSYYQKAIDFFNEFNSGLGVRSPSGHQKGSRDKKYFLQIQQLRIARTTPVTFLHSEEWRTDLQHQANLGRFWPDKEVGLEVAASSDPCGDLELREKCSPPSC